MSPGRHERAWAFVAGVIVCSILSTSLGYIARGNSGVLTGNTPSFGKSKALSNDSSVWPKAGFGVMYFWKREHERLGKNAVGHVGVSNETFGNMTTEGRADLQGEVLRNGTHVVRIANKTGGATTALACVMGVMLVSIAVIVAVMVMASREAEENGEEDDDVVRGIVRDVLDEIAPEEAA